MQKPKLGSVTERIMNAILGIPPVHPLHKSACKECGTPICKKDMPTHMSQHIEVYESVANEQSEREAYRIAH
jgi:hypothetical protein